MQGSSYGRGARILSIGIGTTGLVTFAYFALASHALKPESYSQVSLLWIVLFVIVSVIYRPIEQLLSRTVAGDRARGASHDHALRVSATIQAAFALVFLIGALLARDQIQNRVFDGSGALYWILVISVIAYAASYFARGWLAGNKRFGLYGGLVLLESSARFMFALAAVVGITSGQTAVAAGILAGPAVSLIVLPWAFNRGRPSAENQGGDISADEVAETIPLLDASSQGPAAEAAEEAASDLTLKRGTRFAAAVLATMLAEQALLNVGPLAVHATAEDKALTGIVFNILLIARAPLQLFQSVQTSLLPHLASLEATEGHDRFEHAIKVTALAVAGFTVCVAVGLLVLGPTLMDTLFGGGFQFEREGLALVGLGMGFHLIAGTLNQAALARNRAELASVAWVLSAVLFTAWMLSPTVSDELLRVEIGYLGATFLLSCLLFGLYRRPAR